MMQQNFVYPTLPKSSRARATQNRERAIGEKKSHKRGGARLHKVLMLPLSNFPAPMPLEKFRRNLHLPARARICCLATYTPAHTIYDARTRASEFIRSFKVPLYANVFNKISRSRAGAPFAGPDVYISKPFAPARVYVYFISGLLRGKRGKRVGKKCREEAWKLYTRSMYESV